MITGLWLFHYTILSNIVGEFLYLKYFFPKHHEYSIPFNSRIIFILGLALHDSEKDECQR